VPKGALEVIEYVPRQAAMANAVRLDHPCESEDLWSRLRLEHRTLTSCAAALAAVALHILLIVPAVWGGGASRQPQERYPGDAAMQWVVLNDSSDAPAISAPALSSPVLQAIGVTDALPALPSNTLPAGFSQTATEQADGQSGLGTMYGRYVGQIRARVDRAWQRPRTAIGAPIFQCQVQVDQDSLGHIGSMTLLQCNGNTRWRLSLVHAIEAASPLPAPPNPAVFAPHIVLAFRAIAYSPGVPAQLYEPPTALPADHQPARRETLSQNAFQALRESVRAPHSHKVVELRIEGSRVEVEPQHQ
jgi:TonB C terminal